MFNELISNSAVSIDNKIADTERKINEMLLRTEQLDREIKELLAELQVTPQQLTALVSSKEHFTDKNWEQLLEQRQKLDEKLQQDLAQIRNPKLQKQKLQSLKDISSTWIAVR